MCGLVDRKGAGARAPKAPSETVRLYVRPSWQRGGLEPPKPPPGYATVPLPSPRTINMQEQLATVLQSKRAKLLILCFPLSNSVYIQYECSVKKLYSALVVLRVVGGAPWSIQLGGVVNSLQQVNKKVLSSFWTNYC